MRSSALPVRAVLFDLDGTLIDTAPDMVAALNELLAEEGGAPLPYAAARCHVSHGSNGLVRLAFPGVAEGRFERLRARFLELYRARLVEETQLFPGCDEVLASLEARGIAWGIVTNKPGWLTQPLLEHLHLAQRAGCVVSGDTLAERKPHPLPLQHAARCLDIPPESCVYVGDAQRDILAARGAGMTVLLASFGYIGPHDEPASWAADGQIDHPLELLAWIEASAGDRALQ